MLVFNFGIVESNRMRCAIRWRYCYIHWYWTWIYEVTWFFFLSSLWFQLYIRSICNRSTNKLMCGVMYGESKISCNFWINWNRIPYTHAHTHVSMTLDIVHAIGVLGVLKWNITTTYNKTYFVVDLQNI